ncbi:MAG TPA: hypothetical protein VFG69_18665 [Nannocystaceae bacterium]|nr:hypothetical protein [Nannocystaceae bacterium]
MLRPVVWPALALALGCADTTSSSNCHGVCGRGTQCVQGMCVAVEDEVEPVAADEPEAGKRRRGKGRRRPDGEEPTDDAVQASYQPVDDSRIPRHDPNATRTLDPDAGSERPDDATIRAHLRKLEPAFDRCIADAVAGGVTFPSGRVEFDLGIAASGRVSGVTAKAPSAIQATGVVSCLRKVIYDHRFPGWDGPPMDVEYAFEIG